jgi:ATP-dependent protease ClpP protease subunit
MFENVARITPIFLSTTMLASSLQAEPENPFFLDVAPEEIREITTSYEEIQNACPQLSTVELMEIPFSGIPKTNDTRSIYFLNFIFPPEAQQKQRLEEIEGYRFALKQANTLNDFFVHINSLGGSVETAEPLAYDISVTRGTVVTYASDNAASMGFSLLIAGASDFRYVDADTYLMTHEKNMHGWSGEVIYESDLEPGLKKNVLASENLYLREFIEYNSVTEIDSLCVSMLVQSKTNVQILPEDALKLGLVDQVINWPNSTSVVRAPAPQ